MHDFFPDSGNPLDDLQSSALSSSVHSLGSFGAADIRDSFDPNGGPQQSVSGNSRISGLAAAYTQLASNSGCNLECKKQFVRDHLQEAVSIAHDLGITPAEVLGLAGLESEWGSSRFAEEGNNYFGLHAPAAGQTGICSAPAIQSARWPRSTAFMIQVSRSNRREVGGQFKASPISPSLCKRFKTTGSEFTLTARTGETLFPAMLRAGRPL